MGDLGRKKMLRVNFQQTSEDVAVVSWSVFAIYIWLTVNVCHLDLLSWFWCCICCGRINLSRNCKDFFSSDVSQWFIRWQVSCYHTKRQNINPNRWVHCTRKLHESPDAVVFPTFSQVWQACRPNSLTALFPFPWRLSRFGGHWWWHYVALLPSSRFT